jgi:hypothetical protein
MGIGDISPSYEGFEAFFDAFERERFRRTEARQRLMRANRGLLVGRFSGPLAPLAGGLADALLDEPFRRAVGVDPAPWPIRAALLVGLKTRARVLGCCHPNQSGPPPTARGTASTPPPSTQTGMKSRRWAHGDWIRHCRSPAGRQLRLMFPFPGYIPVDSRSTWAYI